MFDAEEAITGLSTEAKKLSDVLMARCKTYDEMLSCVKLMVERGKPSISVRWLIDRFDGHGTQSDRYNFLRSVHTLLLTKPDEQRNAIAMMENWYRHELGIPPKPAARGILENSDNAGHRGVCLVL